VADGVPQPLNASLCGLAQQGQILGSSPRTWLGERVLDRVEVRTVRRQIKQPRARCFDGRAHACAFMAAEACPGPRSGIVHDDDIAGLQFGHEHLRDPRFRGGRRKRGRPARAWGRQAASGQPCLSGATRQRRSWFSNARGAAPCADAVRAGRAHKSAPCWSWPRPALGPDPRVSSMKISLSGSRSSWPSNQSWRFARMSGRCCSQACAVFMEWPAPFLRHGL